MTILTSSVHKSVSSFLSFSAKGGHVRNPLHADMFLYLEVSILLYLVHFGLL